MLATMMPDKHRQQLVCVKPIGLGPPSSPADLDARRVDHDVVHALLTEPAMQPPAVAPRFVAAVNVRSVASLKPLGRLGDVMGNGFRIAGSNRVAAHAAAAVA